MIKSKPKLETDWGETNVMNKQLHELTPLVKWNTRMRVHFFTQEKISKTKSKNQRFLRSGTESSESPAV